MEVMTCAGALILGVVVGFVGAAVAAAVVREEYLTAAALGVVVVAVAFVGWL